MTRKTISVILLYTVIFMKKLFFLIAILGLNLAPILIMTLTVLLVMHAFGFFKDERIPYRLVKFSNLRHFSYTFILPLF